MSQRNQPVSFGLVNGVLLVTLVGILGFYFAAVSNLPTEIYTPSQQQFLAYNSGLRINQVAPIWNAYQADGAVVPIMMYGWGWNGQVAVKLNAHYEERSGVGVPVYDLDFDSEYQLAYPHSAPETLVQLYFPFPVNLETLHNVQFLVDNTEPDGVQYGTTGLTWNTRLRPGEAHTIIIRYRANGATSFSYGLEHDQLLEKLDFTVTVIGLQGSEIPETSLRSTNRIASEGAETFSWNYTNLIANRDIQLNLPTRPSFAQRVSLLQEDFRNLSLVAPLLVGLFLISLARLFLLANVSLRLESYLLIGCGLALFYPTLTFLSGLMDVRWAAIVSFLTFSALTLSFLTFTVGWRPSGWRAGLLLLIFLGFLSIGMLTPWRGLFLTGGGLLLVALFMIVHSRQPAHLRPDTEMLPKAETTLPESESKPERESASRYCPRCAQQLPNSDNFCANCGYDAHAFRDCAQCGFMQIPPANIDLVYCLRCGQSLAA